jgi:hypothetical protein
LPDALFFDGSQNGIGYRPASRDRGLALAALIARFQGACMPGLVMGVHGAEPTPTDTAVEGRGRVAGLIHWRNSLTRPLEVPGFCLIHLLQHGPSSCGQYTPIGPWRKGYYDLLICSNHVLRPSHAHHMRTLDFFLSRHKAIDKVLQRCWSCFWIVRDAF